MDWYGIGYRIRHKWEDIQMYTRHIYRRVRYHWFTSKILVEVPNLKMYKYTDVDMVFAEVNFHLFRNFVERERDGVKGLEKDISWMSTIIEEGPKKEWNRDWYPEEKESLQRQLDTDRQILKIYTYVQNRKTSDDYWDLPFEEQEKLDNEETDMLVKIVSLRRHLWT